MADLATPIVDGAISIVAGGVQRLAWEQGDDIALLKNLGFWVTGGMILGGVVGQLMFRQPFIQQVARDLANSGATVAGWVGSEKLLIPEAATRRVGHLPAETRRAMLEAARGERVASRVGATNGARAMALAMGDVVELD